MVHSILRGLGNFRSKKWKFPRKRVWITCLILYFIGQDVINYYSATPLTDEEALEIAKGRLSDYFTSDQYVREWPADLTMNQFEVISFHFNEKQINWYVKFRSKTTPAYRLNILVEKYGTTDTSIGIYPEGRYGDE